MIIYMYIIFEKHTSAIHENGSLISSIHIVFIFLSLNYPVVNFEDL